MKQEVEVLDFAERNEIYEQPQVAKNRWNNKTYMDRMSGENHNEIELMVLSNYVILKRQKLIWLPNLDISIIWDCTFKETSNHWYVTYNSKQQATPKDIKIIDHRISNFNQKGTVLQILSHVSLLVNMAHHKMLLK